MPLYTFKNLETGEIEELTLSYDAMKEKEKDPNFQRLIEMPAVNTSNSATFLDGHAPNSRKKAIDLEKKIATTTAKMYGVKLEDREEIRKEINAMKKTRKAPIGENKGE